MLNRLLKFYTVSQLLFFTSLNICSFLTRGYKKKVSLHLIKILPFSRSPQSKYDHSASSPHNPNQIVDP